MNWPFFSRRRRRNPRRCLGFTLIELLVVIAIIGTLVALLLPAVQAAREQARRAACQNNLKQIGLALAQYANRHGAFPPGYVSIWDLSVAQELGPGWGWASMILPELEQQALSNNIKFESPMHLPGQSTVRTAAAGRLLLPGRCDVPDLDGERRRDLALHGQGLLRDRSHLRRGRLELRRDVRDRRAGRGWQRGVLPRQLHAIHRHHRRLDPDPVRGRTVDEPEPGTRPGHLGRRSPRRRRSGRAPRTRSTPTAARASARTARA